MPYHYQESRAIDAKTLGPAAGGHFMMPLAIRADI